MQLISSPNSAPFSIADNSLHTCGGGSSWRRGPHWRRAHLRGASRRGAAGWGPNRRGPGQQSARTTIGRHSLSCWVEQAHGRGRLGLAWWHVRAGRWRWRCASVGARWLVQCWRRRYWASAGGLWLVQWGWWRVGPWWLGYAGGGLCGRAVVGPRLCVPRLRGRCLDLARRVVEARLLRSSHWLVRGRDSGLQSKAKQNTLISKMPVHSFGRAYSVI